MNQCFHSTTYVILTWPSIVWSIESNKNNCLFSGVVVIVHWWTLPLCGTSDVFKWYTFSGWHFCQNLIFEANKFSFWVYLFKKKVISISLNEWNSLVYHEVIQTNFESSARYTTNVFWLISHWDECRMKWSKLFLSITHGTSEWIGSNKEIYRYLVRGVWWYEGYNAPRNASREPSIPTIMMSSLSVLR